MKTGGRVSRSLAAALRGIFRRRRGLTTIGDRAGIRRGRGGCFGGKQDREHSGFVVHLSLLLGFCCWASACFIASRPRRRERRRIRDPLTKMKPISFFSDDAVSRPGPRQLQEAGARLLPQ